MTFGGRNVLNFCLLASFASILYKALQRNMMPFVFGKRDLSRANDPLGYWVAIAIIGGITLGQLYRFAEEAFHFSGHS